MVAKQVGFFSGKKTRIWVFTTILKKYKTLTINTNSVPPLPYEKLKQLTISPNAFHTVRGVPPVPVERFIHGTIKLRPSPPSFFSMLFWLP